MLCSRDSGKELSFSGAGSSNGLCFASVGDGATTEKECLARSRAAVPQITALACVASRNATGSLGSTFEKSGRSVSIVERMKLEGKCLVGTNGK